MDWTRPIQSSFLYSSFTKFKQLLPSFNSSYTFLFRVFLMHDSQQTIGPRNISFPWKHLSLLLLCAVTNIKCTDVVILWIYLTDFLFLWCSIQIILNIPKLSSLAIVCRNVNYTQHSSTSQNLQEEQIQKFCH